MKKVIILSLSALCLSACKKNPVPFPPNLAAETMTVTEAAQTVTIPLDSDVRITDITMPANAAEWCSIEWSQTEITATLTANALIDRSVTFSLNSIERTGTATLIQSGPYSLLDWTGWTATGNSVQANDGGGYPSLFTVERTTFWHSSYSSGAPALPWYIVVDMKSEQQFGLIALGRRHYAANGNNYGTFKTVEVWSSTDDENYTKAGEGTFSIPWTSPDGTVVSGTTSPLIPPYMYIELDAPTTARYVKLVITAVNSTNNTAQISSFQVYKNS